MPAGGVGSAPLTGRAAEVGTLAAVLHRACGGVLAAATLEGEAGIGKTRLLDEAHALATAAAAGVLRGVAEEFQRTRPFALVASLLAPSAEPPPSWRQRSRARRRPGAPTSPPS